MAAQDVLPREQRTVAPGQSRNYRAFVGPAEKYDLVGAMQFNLLTALGLREEHYLVDIGAGSLRAGRLFIPYLLPGRYHAVEPESWLIEEGIAHEIGRDLVRIKKPVFLNDDRFALTRFGRTFDFLLAHSIFSHASQDQIHRCLAEARKVMAPAAIFAATYLPGQENYSGSDWVYPGTVAYTLEHLQEIARQEGLASMPLDWKHPNRQRWVCFVHPEYGHFFEALNPLGMKQAPPGG